MSNNLDEYKLSTPPEQPEYKWITRCGVCNDPIEDHINIIEFRGLDIHCCGFCKNEVLTGNIK